MAIPLVGAVLLGTACGQLPPESTALANVIRGAETVQLTMEPPLRYRQDGNGDAVLQTMLDRCQPALAPYYLGKLLADKVSTCRASIQQTLRQSGGGSIGGVKSVDLSSVHIATTVATASARVSVWFNATQFWYQDPAKARFSAGNVIDYQLHFTRDGNRWKIDQEAWQFAPGGGP